MNENSIKIDQLTFTRFLAATAIVVFHYGKFVPPFNSGILSRASNNANICVSYFFVLSGFIMVVAYHRFKRISFKKYYINRFSRIYPVYLLALLITLFFVVTVKAFDLTGFSLHLFLLQGWVPRYTMDYNVPGWSLSVEAFFYLLFPLLYNFVYTRFNLNRVFLWIIIFWFLMQTGFFLVSKYGSVASLVPFSGTERFNFLFYSPFLHLDEFLAGNAAGLLFMRIKSGQVNYSKNIVAACLFFSAIVVFSLLFLIPNAKDYFAINLHDGLLAIIFIPFILWLSLSKNTFTSILSSKPLVFLGNISYEMYILQFPVFATLTAINLKLKLAPTSFFYFGLIGLILFSAICHLLIEKPLLRLIRKYMAK